MMQTTGLHVFLLGPMRIERDGVRIHLPRRKVESLLAYLLLHPEAHTRDHLASLFWGDSSDTQARHSLRTALATVRQQVSPELLLTDRDQVQLNADFPVWVDVHELLDLEKRLDQTDNSSLRKSLALWQGELLAGLYDEWITFEREVYRTRLLDLFLQVTQTLRARSEYEEAIAVAQQILVHDPANEHAHQHLMFCYVVSGDRPAALRQYEICERVLQDDLDAPPMPETTALYQWIKQHGGEERATAGRITNLPIPLTSFVGRTRETAEVKRLLTLAQMAEGREEQSRGRAVRLLTLLGAGGSGKTRLAIQAATDLIDSFTHGVWWVELAALSDDALVARAVAKALGVSEVADQPLMQSVINFIGDKQLLLVIDNCEHLIDPCAHLAAELLANCPNLQILATSREPLNIGGEQLWQVPTFAVPDPVKLAVENLLLQFESIRLFVERAAAVQPGFTVTLANARAVVEICQRLDGIPLAIELAAARVKVLDVGEIAAYLSAALGARFALLTQGGRSVLPRHQTLRAAIDWSYDLLDDAERLLFRQLAVFRGSFTLAAIEQIVGADAHGLLPSGRKVRSPLPNTLDLLTQLVDKSLVIVETQAGERRYRLLESLREYALEQFSTADELERLQRRHAEFFTRLAEEASPELTGARQQSWLARLEADHANLREALAYTTAGPDRELALRLTVALAEFWDVRVYLSEGRDWLDKALQQRGAASAEMQAKALCAAGFLAYRQDDYTVAMGLLQESLMLFEHTEEESGIAEALHNLAAVDLRQGRYQIAKQRLEQSLDMFRSLEHSDGMARVLNTLGNWAWDRGQFQAAREYYLESLQIRQRNGDQVGIATAFFNLGNTARAEGDFIAARNYYDECLAISRALDHQALFGIALKNLGLIAFHQQDYIQARHAGEQALQILLEIGDKSNAAFTYSNLGFVARKLGEFDQALSHFCRCLQLMHNLGHIRGMLYGLESIAALLADLNAHPLQAVQLIAAAASLRQQANLVISPAEPHEHNRVLGHLQQQVEQAAFRTAWETGQATPLPQIVATAMALSLS